MGLLDGLQEVVFETLFGFISGQVQQVEASVSHGEVSVVGHWLDPYLLRKHFALYYPVYNINI